jgi:hypothetical protein
LQKLSQWYRCKYKCPEVTKTDSSSLANPFTAVFSANIEKAPHKLSLFNQYFKLYYQLRIKEEYRRHYTIAKKSYDATEKHKQSGAVKKLVTVLYRTKVGRGFWLLKTEEFWVEIAKKAEDAHAKEVEEWEAAKQVPKIAQEFHHYVESVSC